MIPILIPNRLDLRPRHQRLHPKALGASHLQLPAKTALQREEKIHFRGTDELPQNCGSAVRRAQDKKIHLLELLRGD